MRPFKITFILITIVCFNQLVFGQDKNVNATIMRKYSELRTWKYAYENGASIAVRPDDSSALIQIRAFSPGGALLFPAADYSTAIHAGEIVSKGISAALTGTGITFAVHVNKQFTNLAITCKQEELEDALKLITMCFTAPPTLHGAVSNTHTILPTTADSDPALFLSNEFDMISGYPDCNSPKALSKIDIARAYTIFKSVFSSAGNFSFVFTGKLKESSAMNTSKLLPLISSYLGTLPSNRDISAEIKSAPNTDHFLAEGTAILKQRTSEIPAGKIIKTFYHGSRKSALISMVYHGNYKFTDSTDLQLKVLTALLQEQLISNATPLTNVQVKLITGKFPKENYQVKINFECFAGDYAKAIKDTKGHITALQQAVDPGAVKRYVSAQKLLLKKQYFDSDFWVEFFEEKMMKAEDPYDIAHYPYFFRKATAVTLQKAANDFLKDNNYIQVVVLPAKTN